MAGTWLGLGGGVGLLLLAGAALGAAPRDLDLYNINRDDDKVTDFSLKKGEADVITAL